MPRQPAFAPNVRLFGDDRAIFVDMVLQPIDRASQLLDGRILAGLRLLAMRGSAGSVTGVNSFQKSPPWAGATSVAAHTTNAPPHEIDRLPEIRIIPAPPLCHEESFPRFDKPPHARANRYHRHLRNVANTDDIRYVAY